ncbi:hypothetical protein K1T71_006581 [Dendrolimus kikuchii]|uniref:Uncharacterized protein n=1 Tax=Dendrolimus kikuchii TaxID=765133 RepID=A0ACC1D1F1_9NEOP|nr:hypothetical protein K1T71_006581 [Dendrolimus kikuchii]
MKLAVVVIVVVAGVFLQASSYPAGEPAVTDVSTYADSSLLQFTGESTFHALIAQVANLVVTVTPKHSMVYNFCTAILDKIMGYKSGNVIKVDDALVSFFKSKETIFSRFAEVIIAFTAPNVTWKEIQVSLWKTMASHIDVFKNAFHEFFRDHVFGHIFKFLQATFSHYLKN